MVGGRASVQHFVAVVSLCLCFHLAVGAWSTTIYTSSVNGKDKPACGSVSSPCKSLNFALNRSIESGTNSTRVFLTSGTYNLTSSFTFTRVQNFAIYGEGTKENVVITCPKANTSIAFFISENITLQGFTLANCGNWFVSCVGKKEWIVSNPKFINAIYLNYCWNLHVSNVEIKNTPGVGLTAYSVAGNVEFINVTFSRNVPTEDGHNRTVYYRTGEYAKAGGGLFLLIGQAKHNYVNISVEEAKKFVKGNNVYTIKNCTFDGNKAPMPDFNVSDKTSLPFSRGGGFAIFSTGTSGHNSILIDSCLFTDNKAIWGGGLQAEFQRQSQNNTVLITKTVFENNVATSAGGALRYGSIIDENPDLLPNFLYLIESKLLGNRAMWGGGISIYGPTYLAVVTHKDEFRHGFVLLQSCLLANNQGSVGAAIGVFLMNLNEDEIGPGVPYKLILDNSTLTNNKIIKTTRSLVLGQGTVYSDEVPIILRNGVSITNNSGTAIALDSATLEVSNYVEFKYNKGYQGGALALYGSAKVELKKKSNIVFQENRCKEKGGALHVSAQGLTLVSFNATGVKTHKCFFTYEEQNLDYDEWETNITFQGNGFTETATNPLGRSVFASSLQYCRRVGEPRSNNSALEWNFIKYLDKNGQRVGIQGEVSTDPIEILYNPADWIVAPSQIFNASVKLLDEKGNDVYGIVNIDIIGVNGSNVRLRTISSLFLVHNKIEKLILSGQVGSSFNVVMRTTGGQLVYEIIEGLTLNNCFAGFQQSPGSSHCVCLAKSNDGIQNCSLNGRQVYVKKGYWAGVVNSKFVTSLCPENYCLGGSSPYSIMDPAYLYDNETMCKGHRDSASILCGSCKHGYSVTIGAERCSPNCNNLYLLTAIPYAIVLFLAVMLIMAINLDFFTGYLNAWLYSYQVMNLLLDKGFYMDPFIEFIIGLANFQIKTGGNCFLKGIDDADKLAIMYVLPTYILVSVFVLGRIVRRYPGWCYSKRVKAPFRAFCTLFVLCYTSITSISLKILYPANIAGKVVLQLDGEVDFFQGKHIAYSLLAIVYLVLVVIPFPLTLLFTPFFTKCLRPVYNLNTMKPYYDAFQGCFKDKYRWCAAFYFVCRFYLLLVAIYAPPGTTKYAVLQSSCMMILVVFVYLKPYKEDYKWLNRLDAILLTNLSFITIFSSALNQTSSAQAQAYNVVIHLLMYVPLGYLLYIAIYVACERREQIAALFAAKFHRRMTMDQNSETDHTDHDNMDGIENNQL